MASKCGDIPSLPKYGLYKPSSLFPSPNNICPWYVSNRSLHKDLKIKTAKNYYKKFHIKIINHTNPLISNLASEFMDEYTNEISKNSK